MTASAQPLRTAHVIRSDAEAIAVAHKLAARFAIEASVRDRERRLPVAELDEFSASGLWGITVPKAYGGAGVSYVTVAEVIKIISAADSSLGQIPQNHLGVLDILLQTATEEQKRYYFGKVLQGYRFGNAFSESKSKNAGAFETRIRFDKDTAQIDGEKFYCTGALFAHIVPAVAVNEENKAFIAFIERDTPGLTVIDSWDGFGQRTTASGGVTLERGESAVERGDPGPQGLRRTHRRRPDFANHPGRRGHRHRRRCAGRNQTLRPRIPPMDRQRYRITAGRTRSASPPIGDLEWRVHGTEAILKKAGLAIDAALLNPNEDTVAHASVVVAQAKVLSAEIALLASSKLFELAGTRSVLGKYNLDRHWRNARTHTLHDPARWKYHLIGNYLLNGVKPARHAWN